MKQPIVRHRDQTEPTDCPFGQVQQDRHRRGRRGGEHDDALAARANDRMRNSPR